MEQKRGPSQVDEFLKRLSGILRTQEKRKALLELRGNQAQSLIDFFNALLVDPNFLKSAEPWLRKYTLVTLRRLCENSMLHPQSYILDFDIENASQRDGGGFCDIYQGRYKGQVLCLKTVRLFEKSDKDEMLKACASEAILWSQLDHPNITRFYGIFYLQRKQQRISLVSPWMKNGNIVAYLQKNPQAPRKPFIHDIASGLEYLHNEEIVHGDLKGLNVLVDEYQRACIADFGLSAVLTNKTLGFTNTIAAAYGRTNRWASPELLEDDSRPTRESDIWAFGCVCYEVLTRLLPFHGCSSDFQIFRKLSKGDLPARPDGAKLDPIDDVDAGMWKVMNWCWSTEVEMRPTCGQILEEIKLDTSVQQLRSAPLGGFVQESQRFQHAIRKSSSVQIDLKQVGKILGNLRGPQEKPTLSGPWTKGEKGCVFKSLPNAGAMSGVDGGTATPSSLFSSSASLPSIPTQTAALSRTNDPSMGVNQVFPDDNDIDTIPPELKKEGLDWSAIFSPERKKRLDVTLIHTLGHEAAVRCVRFSADGKYFAAGYDRAVQIYDTKTGEKICGLVHEPGSFCIRSICFSPDGKFLAAGADEGQIRIWDITKKCIRNVFDGHRQHVYSLHFSTDNRFVVSGSADATVRIWDTDDGASRVFRDNEYSVTSAIISLNQQYVAAGSMDGVVHIWDVQTGQLIETLRGHGCSVRHIAFNPDGEGLVIGSKGVMLRLWKFNVPGGQLDTVARRGEDDKREDRGSSSMVNFIGHNSHIWSATVSHDEQWVVSGSEDGRVRFWHAEDAVMHCTLQGHKSRVHSIDLSPVGGMFATGSADKQVRIWRYNTV